MSPPGGLPLVLAFDLVVLVVGAMVATRLLGGRSGAGSGGDPGGWYADAAALADEVQRATTATREPVDPDAVARRLSPLSGRIRRHVRSAPRGVDAEVARQLFDLALVCQRIGAERGRGDALRDGVFLEARLADLGAEAAAIAEAATERGRSSLSESTAAR